MMNPPDDARHAVLRSLRARAETPAEYWELLFTENHLPEDWLDAPHRRFACVYCEGAREEVCPWCRASKVFAHPNTFDAIERVGRRYESMLRAEALLPQAFADYRALRLPGALPTVERFVWVGLRHDRPRFLQAQGALVEARFGENGVARPVAKTLKRQGLKPPWRLTLHPRGEVWVQSEAPSGRGDERSMVNWLNQPLFALWVLNVQVVSLVQGTATLTYALPTSS